MTPPQIYRRKDMLTVAQFAKVIGMSRSFAYQLVERGPQEGGVLAFRYGKTKGLRVPAEEVTRYQQERKVVEV
ncbi:MAG: hypothetical protein AB7D06_08855 [Pedobacter sp.]